MKLSPFFKANISMGWSTGSRILMGMIKTKFSALAFGAEGVGVIGLVSQVQMFGASFCSSSIGNELSRLLSKYRNDPEETKRVVSTCFSLLLLANLVFVILFFLLERHIALYLFGSAENTHYLYPIMVAVPLHSLVTTILAGVFFSHQRLGYYSISSVAGALAELGAFVLFARLWGLSGALWAAGVGLLIWLGLGLYLARKIFDWPSALRFHIDGEITKTLVSTGTVMSISGLLAYGSNAIFRSHFLKTLGAHESGIYHVAIVFSSLYMPFLTNALWARLHPEISAKGIVGETKKEWQEAILHMVIYGGMVQILVGFFAPFLIQILYSKDFLSAAHFVPAFLLGDFFYLAAQPAVAVLLARAKPKVYLAFWVAYYGLLLFCTLLLFKSDGLMGAAKAYLFASLVIFTLSYAVFFKIVREKVWSVFGFTAICGIAVTISSLVQVKNIEFTGKAVVAGLCAAIVFVCWVFERRMEGKHENHSVS